jgi:hypothetical protein
MRSISLAAQAWIRSMSSSARRRSSSISMAARAWVRSTCAVASSDSSAAMRCRSSPAAACIARAISARKAVVWLTGPGSGAVSSGA